MALIDGKRKFPCPVCMDPREVRITKKDKPYITCDPCGIQLFIRGPAGIDAFNRLADRVSNEGLLSKLTEMDRRYHLKCPECGCRFWAERKLVNTDWFNGSFLGFKCPGCGENVDWEKEK